MLFILAPEPLFLQPPELADLSEPTVSVHALELQKHAHLPQVPRTYRFQPGTPRALSRLVYGYLPYWISNTSEIRWQNLSHLGYFSVELSTSGTVNNTRGWPDHALVQTAHAAGVDVEVVFTLFGNENVGQLLNNSTARQTAIANMVDLMEAGNADGINIDFEFVPESARMAFVMFLQELRNELNARGHIQKTISFAAPTGLSAGLDLPAIFQVLDFYFIMAYGYHWSGSTYAGPTGKYRVTPSWSPAGSLSLLRSLAVIRNAVGEDMRHKIIAGLPLYGRHWTTSTPTWPAVATSHVGSVTYSAARNMISQGRTRHWDNGICNPALIWEEGGVWNQVWYDDEQSLACKFNLIKQQDIGGLGYWALGYDNGYSEIWDLLESHFTTIGPLGAGSRDNPIRITSYPYSDTRDTSAGGYRFFNFYGCRPDLAEYGREFIYQVDVCQPGQLTATVPDHPTADPDIHLLSALREDACITRAHLTFTHALQPGRYYLTVDTYVENGVELEGPYTLDVDFTPTGGSPCPEGTVCEAGACMCDGGLTWCQGECVDANSDDSHCGQCNLSCGPQETCTDGICLDPDPPDAGTDAGEDVDTPDPDADPEPCDVCTTTYKCACHAGTRSSDFPLFFMLLLLSGIFVFRKRMF